jgi:hypothetical protein
MDLLPGGVGHALVLILAYFRVAPSCENTHKMTNVFARRDFLDQSLRRQRNGSMVKLNPTPAITPALSARPTASLEPRKPSSSYRKGSEFI